MDPSYLKSRFKKKSLLTCYSVVLLPENVMFAFFFCFFFLCEDVKKCPCVIYIYIYIHAHTHSRADLTVYFFWRARASEGEAPPPNPPAPSTRSTATSQPPRGPLFAVVVLVFFRSSKPYHGSLHFPISIPRPVGSVPPAVVAVVVLGEEYAKPYFL